ncbi:hypothetical protein GHO40_25760 [Pseudomonas helleri]|uniref:Uncharacterized protein n=1 Tax=Pseudomonas helleri TaxID=1608996 RepID=A0A6L5HQ17_9PSED|nr:hypothetical protein [Pseudomonas helleri]MQT61281.1 hypothetical protein [Pseudomonas sp. FSL R10-0399]MQT92774.1 hypothetical protein [Pseudomonas helleri]MQU05449.1 hypothetical protein [Pseudomonas helleri]
MVCQDRIVWDCGDTSTTRQNSSLGIGHICTPSHNCVHHGTVTLFTARDYLQGRLINSSTMENCIGGCSEIGSPACCLEAAC